MQPLASSVRPTAKSIAALAWPFSNTLSRITEVAGACHCPGYACPTARALQNLLDSMPGWPQAGQVTAPQMRSNVLAIPLT